MKLTPDILKVNRQKILYSFPVDLRQDVEIVADYLLDKNLDIHPTVEQHITLYKEKLVIPGRVYFTDPDETTGNTLSQRQQTILNCLYLRHNNGFVRQQRLEQLTGNTDYFAIPFIFQLLGEYVIEILFVLDKFINELSINKYLNFIAENKKYWKQTESRMISYWNEYYRTELKYRKLNEYIGKQIVDRIKQNERYQQII